ncbi:serine-threonine protein kinase, putative [Talaromyces stipitatus ATCC 10500]|uniref:Serine-threonine protein kinase, putative n=1 Tax=Talaromyces stipitatus (strain ATCC 10500 / CBS 375.48 / QM 6759 / NRRL 1006) TaxID=441959 RepID=B8MPP6_TALSN|nr:serine-threonine protein kinase, putative [Talaromyces stipitatus ATCC 10500]EED14485.1 serine-threonine protein kinase, putative [Talaromyces stipitatus ATCC 10500]
MPQNIVLSYELEFKSFQDWNGDHPSQTLVFHDNFSSWWIKVEIGYLKRRAIFQEFVKAIDFGQLDLIDDTVTRISLTLAEQSHKPIPIRNIRNDYQTEANFFLSIAHRVSFQIEEDPGRIIYPILGQDQDLPIFEASHLQDEKVIAPTVSIVRFKQKRFAYKKIDRPIYEAGDTQHILNEIDALAHFRGQPNIAQLIGLVISGNPYKTRPPTISVPVITGFLLEYYTEGCLEQVLAENTVQDDALLRRWALQTGRALEILHIQRRTHLDIKPSNIVFDADKNAILIDISGTGGYEWEWLSPEMQKIIQGNAAMAPASTPFDKRVATDCWAYGKLLLTMAKKIGTSSLGKRLQSIGDDLTKTDPKARISLSDALERIWGQE